MLKNNLKFLIKSVLEYPPDILQKRILFFFLTYISMVLTYAGFRTGDMAVRVFEGFLYATSLMIILLSHEFGHFYQARKYGVECTLPNFIPLPFISPFGTMGAFIRIKATPPSLKALFDISFWGPAMSFTWSIPFLIAGLSLSQVIPSVQESSLFINETKDLMFGSSLLINILQNLLLDIPAGHALVMHPFAYAGWVGLFVTAINLFPVGQLDGGHIAYAFLGKTQIYIAYLFLLLLLLLAAEMTPAWLFWGALLLFIGVRHPVLKIPRPKKNKLSKTRMFFGFASAVIFLVSFIPAPVTVTKKFRPPTIERPGNNTLNFHGIENGSRLPDRHS